MVELACNPVSVLVSPHQVLQGPRHPPRAEMLCLEHNIHQLFIFEYLPIFSPLSDFTSDVLVR